MPKTVDDLVRRQGRIWERMMVWRTIWQELADYEVPRKADVNRSFFWGPRKQTEKMYDETAPQAANELAAEMQGTLTSPSSKWFGLMMRDRDYREEPEWQEWLETCSVGIYDAFQDSNLNEEIQEGYLDLVVFGIMALLMEEIDETTSDFSGFRFEALALGSFAVDENADGLVDVLHRKFRLSARAMVDNWPMDKWMSDEPSAVDTARRNFESILRDDPFRQIDICHAVYPRKSSSSAYGPGRRRKQKEKAYESCYFLEAEKIILDEGGYDEFPFLVPRWNKQPGEIYGRGPGLLALPATKSLNRAIELDFKSWAKDLDPPLSIMDRSVIGRVKTSAAAVNIVRSLDAIKPTFDRRTVSYQPTQIRVDRLETKIKKCFFVDQFQLPGGGPSPGSQNTYMSATETEKRYEIMQQMLGPTLGRLKHELHKPLVERAFRIMATRKAIPVEPESFTQAFGRGKGPRYNVVYEGPLERAQRASSLQSINRAWMVSAPILQAQPEAIDVVDGDNLVREIFKASGTPYGVLKDKRKVNETRAARAEAAQREAQRTQMMEMAETAGRAAPAMKAMQEAASGDTEEE